MTCVGVRASKGYDILLSKGKGIIKGHISHPKGHVSPGSIFYYHLRKYFPCFSQG